MASLRVFVSHSHKDNSWCDGFVDELKQRGLDVWYDRQGLYVGDQWVRTIERELQGREVFLIVLTPDSLASQWVQREFSLALAQNKQIIGVLHQSAQLGGFLTTYQLLDATQLDARQAAQQIAAALAGAAPSSLSFQLPQQPAQGGAGKAGASSAKPAGQAGHAPPKRREGITGAWVSEGEYKVELSLTQNETSMSKRYDDVARMQFTTIPISGTGEHWFLGSVIIIGGIVRETGSVVLRATPVPNSPVSQTYSHIEFNLILHLGKLKGNEVLYGRPNRLTKESLVKGTMSLTFVPVDE